MNTDPLEEARRIMQTLVEWSSAPASSQAYRARNEAAAWLAANAPKPPVPRRASVAYNKGYARDPWGQAWPVSKDWSVITGERVEMIEMTKEVIAALRAAGIAFEDSEKIYQEKP